MDVRFSGRYNAATVKNFERSFHRFVFVRRSERRRGHVVVCALLHRASSYPSIAVLNVLLLDDVVYGFEQKRVSL